MSDIPSSTTESIAWVRRVDRALGHAAAEVRLLGAVTPIDVERERSRLIRAFEAGREATPRWEYPRGTRAIVREHLAAAEAELRGVDGLLAVAYAARAAEVALEAAAADAAGT